MICAILLSAGFAAYLGANVTVNVNDLVGIALKNYLERELNSSFYLLQKPCSYIISMVGSYVCLQNGTSGKLELYDTNATNIWQNGLSSSNGKTIYAKAATYQLGDYGLILPESIEIIGENRVTFNYTGDDWAIKTNNTNIDTGKAIIKNINVNIDGSEISGCKGGILLANMTSGFLEGVSVSGGGSPSGTTAGIKIADRGGNKVILLNCEVGGFDKGYWVTADWVMLQKCNDYSSNTGFYVDNNNAVGTRPIETSLFNCFAYHPDYCGFNISYASEFSLIQCAYEGENGNDATAFAISDSGDSNVRGYFAYPTFHDADPQVFYDFSVTYGVTLTIPCNLEHFNIENCGETIVAHNEWVPHGLGDIPTSVIVSSATATYGTPAEPVIVSVKDWNATMFKVGVYWSNGTYITDDAIDILWYGRVF